jgi:predicted DNA-binding transcriptional regulator AlpA
MPYDTLTDDQLAEKIRRPLLTDDEVAEKIQRSTNWLAKLRCRGEGPTFLKVGRSIRYRWQDVEAWLESQARQSTSEPAEAGRARR